VPQLFVGWCWSVPQLFVGWCWSVPQLFDEDRFVIDCLKSSVTVSPSKYFLLLFWDALSKTELGLIDPREATTVLRSFEICPPKKGVF
jgi:hypothetical protein